MVVAELLTRLGFEVDPRELNRGISRAQTSLQGFKSFLGKLALGVGFFEIGSHVMKTARELETMSTQLQTFTGSSEKAKFLFKGITDYAKETSFYVKDIMQATTLLMAGGVGSKEAIPIMKKLGDIAPDNTRLGRLAMAYGRVNAKGFMSGQENMMFNRGGWFNPLMQLARKRAEEAGLLKKGDEVTKGSAAEKFIADAQAEMTELVKHKQFTIKMLDEAIEYSTSKGGMYYQHQAEQVKTFTGAFSNMLDVMQINAGMALQKLFPIFKELMKAVTAIPFDWLSDAFEQLSKVIEYVGYVMVKEGILDVWAVLKDTFLEFVAQLPPGANTIEMLAHVLSFAARTVLSLAVGLLQLGKIFVAIGGWILEHKMLMTAVAMVLAQLAVPSFMRWIAASAGMVSILKTLGTLVLWFLESPLTTFQIVISQLIPKIQAMWMAIAGGGIALPAIAAVLSVANAIRVLQDTLAENKALADNKEYAEGVTRIMQKRIANVAALNSLKGRENQNQDLVGDLKHRISANDRELADWKAQFGVGGATSGTAGFDQWKADYDKLAGQAAAEAAKHTDLLQEQNRKLDQIAGNTAPKSGVPNDVLKLADMSFRTHFDVIASGITLAAE